MANIITLTATDGSTVEFYDEIKASGGVKDVYFSTDGTYVVGFYRKALSANDRQRIEDIVNVHRQRIFTPDAAGQYWENFFAWPTKIVEWNEKVGLVMPFYDKKFFFSGIDPRWPFMKDGQEKNGKWFSSAKLYNRFVPDNQKGNLLTRLHMCLKIARAIRRLHAAGLAHSDLSYNNVLVDPLTGNACIIDCDGLVVPKKFPPEVVGTPGFIAPEVMATRALPLQDPKKNLPQISTDRHALAVLIYTFLLQRHPLDGGKVWDVNDTEHDDDLRYGEKALFIEHPYDATNREALAARSARIATRRPATAPLHPVRPLSHTAIQSGLCRGTPCTGPAPQRSRMGRCPRQDVRSLAALQLRTRLVRLRQHHAAQMPILR